MSHLDEAHLSHLDEAHLSHMVSLASHDMWDMTYIIEHDMMDNIGCFVRQIVNYFTIYRPLKSLILKDIKIHIYVVYTIIQNYQVMSPVRQS